MLVGQETWELYLINYDVKVSEALLYIIMSSLIPGFGAATPLLRRYRIQL